MPAQKELKRVLEIARSHARNALAKDASQRESYLAFCRAHWKRYAAGFNKSEEECERFAAEMDRTTRALIALRNEFASYAQAPGAERQALRDTVEGAMDSVLVHEAAIESPDALPEPDDKPEAVTENGDADAPAVDPEESAEMAAKTLEQQRFEEMDRANARFGFTFPSPKKEESNDAEKSGGDPELQRRVRSVLRSRQQAKLKDD